MNDLCRLDTAINNHGYRQLYHTSLIHWQLFSGIGKGTEDADRYIDWVLLRGIKVRMLHRDVILKVLDMTFKYLEEEEI